MQWENLIFLTQICSLCLDRCTFLHLQSADWCFTCELLVSLCNVWSPLQEWARSPIPWNCANEFEMSQKLCRHALNHTCTAACPLYTRSPPQEVCRHGNANVHVTWTVQVSPDVTADVSPKTCVRADFNSYIDNLCRAAVNDYFHYWLTVNDFLCPSFSLQNVNAYSIS